MPYLFLHVLFPIKAQNVLPNSLYDNLTKNPTCNVSQ